MAGLSQKMRVDLQLSGSGVRAVALKVAVQSFHGTVDIETILRRADKFQEWIETGEVDEDHDTAD